MGDKEVKNRNENKKLKRLYLATVALFIIAVVLFIFQQRQPVQEKEPEMDNDLIIESELQEEMSEEEKAEAANKKKVQEEIEKTVTDFIEAYYSYDTNNRFKSLEDAEPFLTADFYEELEKTEDENTKVPIHAYRKVTKINLQDYQRMGEDHTIIAKTTAEQLDENKKLLSTVGVEFHFNVVRDRNEWKISYFALFGKSLEANEE